MIRKTNVFALVVLILVATSCKTTEAKRTDAKAPAGHWAFDEGSGIAVADSRGSVNGAMSGTLGWADGRYGKAISSTGEGYVSIPHTTAFNSDNYTLMIWLKLQDVDEYMYVWWKNGLNWPEAQGLRRFDVWVQTDGSLQIEYDNDQGDRKSLVGKTVILDDVWHHVAVTYDGTSLNLVIDGQLDSSETVEGKLVTNDYPLWIGARPGLYGKTTGLFDDFRYYTRCLPVEEIAELIK